MSVVIRKLDGRDYIHVRRKVNKKQMQRFFNINDLCPDEVKCIMESAYLLDDEWNAEQHNDSLMGLFFHNNGDIKHVKILPPYHGESIRINVQIHKSNTSLGAFLCCRSVDKHGLYIAFNESFNKFIDFLGFDLKSPSIVIIKKLIFSKINDQYKVIKKEFG